jgi:hypothetical protein
MKNAMLNILLPLAAVAATAVPIDPARACAESPAADPAKSVKAAPATPKAAGTQRADAGADFCLRRPALRAF